MSETKILTLIVGPPASGKSTYATAYANSYNATIVSRDAIGGTLQSLVPKVEALLQEGRSVVLDNTNITKEMRRPFIECARRNDAKVHIILIESTIESCQVNALRRMWATHGRLYLGPNGHPRSDPHTFPVAALFSARKIYEKPAADEADKIIKPLVYKEEWEDKALSQPALFLDIDGTLRETEHLEHKYPLKPAEVVLTKPAAVLRAAIDAYRGQGYKIIGISNQSGIAKGILTEADADACFDRTRELLGLTADEFPILYCPHRSAPITCYCRKPQSGLFVKAALTYDINIPNSIMVGDLKTDETAAQRLGMRFIHASKFA